jgi:hypothetical protein
VAQLRSRHFLECLAHHLHTVHQEGDGPQQFQSYQHTFSEICANLRKGKKKCKKKGRSFGRPFICSASRLCLFDGTHRADAGAGTAVDASVRVNLVDVTGGDGSNRAFIDASAASSAVFSDFVSHFYKSLSVLIEFVGKDNTNFD